MRVLLKKKHEEDELRRSNIRRTHGDPEEEEEEDGCIHTYLPKGRSKSGPTKLSIALGAEGCHRGR